MAEERVVVEILGDATSFIKMMNQYNAGLKQMQDNTAKAMKAMNERSKKATKEQEDGLKRMTNAWKKYGSTIRQIMPGLGLLIMSREFKRFFSDASKEFADFDKGMREVFTLVPEYAKQFRVSMTNEVLQVSVEMARLTDETVPALYQAISAGIPAGNALEFLKDASIAARGGVATLEKSVDVLTSIINAYGLEASAAADISDALFAAVQGGKLTFTQFAASAANVIPIAAAVGVSIEEVSAALAAMTKQGVPMRTATTQLRQVLMHLSTAGKEAADIFSNAAGVSFQEFIAQGNSLADALLIMEQRAKETGVNVNELFGNIRAGMGSLSLTGAGMDLFNAELERQANNAGVALEANNEMINAFQVTKDTYKAAMETFKISIGAALEPMATGFYEAATAALIFARDVATAGDTITGFTESADLTTWAGIKIAMVETIELFREMNALQRMNAGDDLGESMRLYALAIADTSTNFIDFVNKLEQATGGVVEYGRVLETTADGSQRWVANGMYLDVEGLGQIWAASKEDISNAINGIESDVEGLGDATGQWVESQGDMVQLLADMFIATGQEVPQNLLLWLAIYAEESKKVAEASEEVTQEMKAEEEAALRLAQSIGKVAVSGLNTVDAVNAFNDAVLDSVIALGAESDAVIDVAESFGVYTEGQIKAARLMGDIETARHTLIEQYSGEENAAALVAERLEELFGHRVDDVQAILDQEAAEKALKEELEGQPETYEDVNRALEEHAAALHAAKAAAGDYFTTLIEGKDEAGVFTVALEDVGEQTVFNSNMTGEQAQELADYREELAKSKDKLRDWELGIKSAGSTAEKAGKKMGDMRAHIADMERNIAALVGLGGEYVTVNNEVIFSQDHLNQSLYEATDAADANANVLADLGVALGMFSQEEANAALQAVAMQMKIEELGRAIAEGMGIDEALAELDEFKARLGEDFGAIIETGDTNASAAVGQISEVREEAQLLGDEMPIVVEIEVKEAGDDLDDMADHFENAADEIDSFHEDVGDNLGDFGGDMEGVEEAVDESMDTVVEEAESGFRMVREAYGEGATSAVKHFNKGLQPVAGYAKKNIDVLHKTVKSGEGPMSEAGMALVAGLISGLISKQGALYETVWKIVKKAIDTANAAAETGSPSKEMMEVGSDMGEGLLWGLLSWDEIISRAMRDMVSDAINAGADAVGESDAEGMSREMAKRFYEMLSQGYMTPSMARWLRDNPFPSYWDWYKDVWTPGNPTNAPDIFPPGLGPGGSSGGRWAMKSNPEAAEAYKRAKHEWVMETFGGWRNYDAYMLAMLMAQAPGWDPESGGFPEITNPGASIPVGIPFGGFGGDGFQIDQQMLSEMLGAGTLFEATANQIDGIIEQLLKQYGDMSSEAAEEWIRQAKETGILTFPEDFPDDIKFMIENLLSTGIIPVELLQMLDFAITDLELVLDLIGMLEPQTEQWLNAMDRVLGVANDLMGSASFFADLFEEQTIGPLADRMDELIGEAQNVFDLSDEEILAQLPDLIDYAQQTGNTTLLDQLLELQALQIERNELEQELLEIQQQQQQLAFLQQQLDLLRTIQEAGLDPASILGDITLGLDASVPDLMAAISAVIQALIDEANDQLEIASPSGVFFDMGLQSAAGYAAGLLSGASEFGELLDEAIGPDVFVGPSTTTTVTNVSINFGDTVLSSSIDELEFADRVENVIREALYP